MLSTNSQSPPPPAPSRTKTERGAVQKSRPSRKRNPPSAPAVIQSSDLALDPVTPASLFLPLTVQLDDTFSANTPVPPPPNPPATYIDCIARLADLVADSSLTAAQSTLLQAAMTTAQFFVAPTTVHPLLHTIASPRTTPSEIVHLSTIVTAGMQAFVARPGPFLGPRSISTASSGTSHSSSRNDVVKTACAARDNSTCVVTGKHLGFSCHIIPFSVRGEKANNFWAFVAMFKGPTETQRLKTLALGHPPCTDCVRNVLWLSPDSHVYFDAGKLAIVPTTTTEAYDPSTATEYSARVELPYGPGSVQLHVWSTSPTGVNQSAQLQAGQTITLRTSDPLLLPLPHPILLQLHTAFTRLRKMSAAAGVPILPSPPPSVSSDYQAVALSVSDIDVDYEERLTDHLPMPLFEENDLWTSSSAGLPLKERFVQLLEGARDSEGQQYCRVIERWDGGGGRKRAFEMVESDQSSGSSVGRKRRWSSVGRGKV